MSDSQTVYVHAAFITSIAYIFLIIFYKLYQTNWPSQYFTADEIAGYKNRVNPIYYVVFRFLPVFIALMFLGDVLIQLGVSKAVAGIYMVSMATIHFITSNGIVIIKLLLQKEGVRLVNYHKQLILHFVSLAFIALAFFFAYQFLGAEWVSKLAPSPENLVDNVWAALLIALFVGWINQRSSSSFQISEIVAKEFETIPAELLAFARKMSKKYKADQVLLLSVLVTESLQRPRWVRNIEQVLGRIFRRGTYGIMQHASDKPISDKESIEIAAKNYFSNTDFLSSLRENDYLKYTQTVEDILRNYNADQNYKELVEEVLSSVQYDYFAEGKYPFDRLP